MYWDANASAQLRPVAREAAMDFLACERASNPSSVHAEGRQARAVLRKSREQILRYLGLSSVDVDLCFTSGGTEACNSLVHGFCPLNLPFTLTSAQTVSKGGSVKPHILTTSIEHVAMLEPIRRLASSGYDVTYVSPNETGQFVIESFVSSVKKETELVSIMLANNETGLILPVVEIIQALRSSSYQGPIVCDASQAVSKSGISLKEVFNAGADAISVSAHKMGSLPGIGAVLFSKTSTCRLYDPLVLGGPQEGKKRGGTEFVLGAHVWGRVAEYLITEEKTERSRRKNARDLLFKLLSEAIPDIVSYTNFENSLDNTLLIQIPHCRGDDLVVALDLEGLSVSIGAACSSGKQDVSHVLLAMGISKKDAKECIRISLDWDVTDESVKEGVSKIIKIVHRMRLMTSQNSASGTIENRVGGPLS